MCRGCTTTRECSLVKSSSRHVCHESFTRLVVHEIPGAYAMPLSIAVRKTPTKATTAAAVAAVAGPSTRHASSAAFPIQCTTGRSSHPLLHHGARRRSGKVELPWWGGVSSRDGPDTGCGSDVTMAGNRRQLGRGLASRGRALVEGGGAVKVSGGLGRGMSTGRVPIWVVMPEEEFHFVADGTLDCIHDAVESALEDGFEGDFDCDLSQGVLNLVITGKGTWVLNKQAPNRQIWWSSPISGPMRFDYDQEEELWLNSRDGCTELAFLLASEIEETCGVVVEPFSEPL